MRFRGFIFTLLVGAGVFTFVQRSPAQSPAQVPAPIRAAALKPAVEATLAQLMKGILSPSSNVVFAAQSENPADVPPAKDPSMATNPLASSYGKWEAVENAALAIAEASNLLTIPGRKCSNGLSVPLSNADWPMLVRGLREAGVTAYKAAQTKNQDKILEAADVLTTACANCHDKYREKAKIGDRCK